MYDKLYREDCMREAWRRVKANKGSSGIDGISLDHIVKDYGEERLLQETIDLLKSGIYQPQPVRRHEIPKPDGKMRPLGIPTVQDRLVQTATKIVVESIFEADFRECSFGFRPKRSMHGALQRIRKTVNEGSVYWVVDVDITGYFDNIPHDKLMALVEQRISDRRILKLIRKWLEAGYIKDNQFHVTEIGSPQGGVISPLLANIYLNYLDTIWERKFSHLGTLVRFADDLVILCNRKEQSLEAIDVLKAVFAKLELTMNTKKSKLVNLWIDKKGFDFLGYHHRRLPILREGGRVAHILRSFPSKKAMEKMRTQVKEVTARRNRLMWSLNDMVKVLNPKIQGWRNYYTAIDPGVSNGFLRKIDWYIHKRLALFWNKKHKRRKSWHMDFNRTLSLSGLKSVASWTSTYCTR
ncbi:group II intron reverse transcriptase/maturase [Paenibacillus sepulcri]|uniref:group II intron reverse transcriptase/maturase n=1 Tax=Paenibacillus sepulcri TaxID=359917 RepID=UPI0035EC8197